MDYNKLKREMEKEILDGGAIWINGAEGEILQFDIQLNIVRVTRRQAAPITNPIEIKETLSTFAPHIIYDITQRKANREKIAKQFGGIRYTPAEGVVYAEHENNTLIDAL